MSELARGCRTFLAVTAVAWPLGCGGAHSGAAVDSGVGGSAGLDAGSGVDGGAVVGDGGTLADSGSGTFGADGSGAEPDAPLSCTSPEILCGGACVVTSSCAFAVTSLTPATGWQNGRGYVTLSGTGFAPGTTVSIGDGQAPARVVNATTILIETPPGPLGPQDVTVSLGGATATLKGAFTYKGAGLTPPWQQRGLTTGRNYPSMAVLQDGRVLIAGGESGLDYTTALDTADLYTEPAAMAVAVSSTMGAERIGPAGAVTLLTGKVVVVGGDCMYSNATGGCDADTTAVDLFDPVTNTFTPSAASMPGSSVVVSGVLLVDGRVLFVNNTSPDAAIYDPDADTITTVPLPLPLSSQFGLFYPFMARLRDGRVLVGAGDTNDQSTPANYTFLFDPATDTFTPTGAFVVLRDAATATTLPDGRVMVLGGVPSGSAVTAAALDSIELYDPVAGTFSLAPYTMSSGRIGHATVLVRDGTVLAIAGSTNDQSNCTTPGTEVASVDQIDPVAGTVTAFPPLAQPVTQLVGVVLHDGSVLVGGGAQCGVAPQPYVDFLQGVQ